MGEKKNGLTVYKASAGSGKTFTLATEYIKLLVRNPQAYRETLAVTFTNKATEEMKMRVVSHLYGIWQQLPESRGYLKKVCRETGVTEAVASRQAGLALHELLHHYSWFRVETIDSFFQSILRNLARELDLTANLRVGLNDEEVEEMAVDEMIDSLTVTDELLGWLMKYVVGEQSEQREAMGVNGVMGSLKKFGRTIFKDYYKEVSGEVNEAMAKAGFLDGYEAKLREMRSAAQERMMNVAESFFDELEGAGLAVEDLSYGKLGVAGFFLKLKDGVMDASIVGKRVLDCVEDPSKIMKKKDRDDEVALRLGDIVSYAVQERERQWRVYKSADLTLRHLWQLRLLSSIEERVRRLNESANRFLLSDTQMLLHSLIAGSDTPFIYEKTGSQIEHIMIDEFQDTSVVQWQNFKVLVDEALSRADGTALVVGDVKQSIYRWRGGDWRLLGEGGVCRDGAATEKTLDVNFRSSVRVIQFNNAFFTEAAAIEEQEAAYSDVAQKWPEGKPVEGAVEVRLLPGGDYKDETLRLLAERVRQLSGEGVEAKDIAILVRSNNYIPTIANYFMSEMPGVNVVSDEAFRLDASPAVMTIVVALRYILHRDDSISRAALCKAFSGSATGGLPADFEGHEDELARMPLYDLCETIADIFRLGEMAGQESYLCAFYDQVTKLGSEQATDLSSFLRDWDESLCSKTIQSPDVDGIRLISIHKSKGLEFPHVLLPFCDWKMEHADILWCKPKEKPFSQLPIAPIDYSKKGMTGTIYEEAYDEEHQQATVDNLNLLYVAFTRASESLFVIGKRNSRGSRSGLIEQVLPLLPKQLAGSSLEGEAEKDAALVFRFGAVEGDGKDGKDGSDGNVLGKGNPFLSVSSPVTVSLRPRGRHVALRQNLQSQRFAQVDDNGDEAGRQQQEAYIQAGNVLHEVFSTIRTTADINQALQRLEQEGIIYDRHLTRPRLEDMIRRRLSDPRVADWFSDRWTLFNECSILTIDAETGRAQSRRPDRVMTDGQETIVVDFKFGRQESEHQTQVRQYVELLRQMGYQRVQGFLWYVYSNKIVTVL